MPRRNLVIHDLSEHAADTDLANDGARTAELGDYIALRRERTDMRAAQLIAPVAAVALTGCATIARGSSDTWQITSEPAGARVETSHGYFCEATPCAIKMPRKSTFTATVTKPGYKPGKVIVTHKSGGAGSYAGSFIMGGLIGTGIDASSGAMLDLVPNPAHVKLEPEMATAPP